MNLLAASIPWVTLFLMLAGLLLVLVPVLPGLALMWLAALGYGIATGFNTLGLILMGIITLLALVGSVVDNLLMGVGAKKGGASWLTILVALVAGLVGTILFPPLGGFIAAPLAILLLEYARVHDLHQAWLVLKGLAAGWGAAVILRLMIGLVILGLWLLWVWKG